MSKVTRRRFLQAGSAVATVAGLGIGGGVTALANTVVSEYSRMISDFMGIDQSFDTSELDTSDLNLEFYTCDYDSDTITAAEQDLDERLVAEGIVLAQNDDASLPLAAGTTVSLLGANSRDYSMASELEAVGLDFNQALFDYYDSGNGAAYVQGTGSQSYGDDEDFVINECPLSALEEDGMLDSLDGTVPIFVFKRVAGEGRDAPRSMYNHASNSEDQQRTYLEPDSTELEILQYMNDNFDNGVILVDAAVVVELGWLADFPNIRSVLLVPSTGTYGMASLAGILAGTVNPSGRTVDTFAADSLASPAIQNFGDYQYVDESGELTKYNYVSYAEGIYVGYKYYETRYEDAVMGTGNAGDFDYDSEVVYPFGHGLSYTSFEWSDFSASWADDVCTVEVTVTNTGDMAGKEVVEVYAQTPYTDYDVENGVEKAAVQLVGYGKTSELEPSASETVTIEFDESELKAYDSKGAGTYILDAGTYYVTAAADAHAAVQNVLAAKGYDVDGDASRVGAYVPSNTDVDVEKYSVDTYTGVAVGNLFDDASYDGTYLTRSDWEGTFPAHDGEVLEGTVSTWGNEINGEIDGEPASLLYIKTASDDLIAQLDSTDSGNPDLDSIDDEPVYGADNGVVLADLRGADYDDPLWDDLLDELTADDYELSIARGGYGTEALESVGKPFNVDADTAAGLYYGGTGTTFAGPLMLAQTFNQDMALEYGQMIGNESLLGGAAGWYAPSMNIHRTPYSGRNGEYYSEDGFLSGRTASLSVKGAAEKGLYATIKHFAFNDQENHRGDRDGQYSIATWLNEQSAREIYLKPFEMCMKVGDVDLNYVVENDDGTYENATRQIRAAQAIMTAFNRVGATWTGGSYPLLTGLVRNEWGFNGWIITDNANTGVFMDGTQMLTAGGDTKLTTYELPEIWSFDPDSSIDYHYGREAMHHLLYTTANSHVMDGSMPGCTYTSGALVGETLQTGLTVGGIVVIGLTAFAWWRHHKKDAKRKAEIEAEKQAAGEATS